MFGYSDSYTYVSDYKKLPMQDRDIYKRRARVRHYARANNLVVHKIHMQDKYLVRDNKGETRFYNLNELEKLMQDLKDRYKAAKLGDKNDYNSKNQSRKN